MVRFNFVKYSIWFMLTNFPFVLWVYTILPIVSRIKIVIFLIFIGCIIYGAIMGSIID